jgi:CheY-like chemotaxis protein
LLTHRPPNPRIAVPPNDSDNALRAARAQAAVVRTLTTEMQREGSGQDLQAQAVEESARLISVIEGLSQARSSAPAPASPPPAEGLAAARRRVLVVEDDDESRAAVVVGLTPAYDVTTARDGLEGLNAAMATRFDAIVTDIRMPGMDGVAMVDRIRAIYAPSFVPVVFLTAEKAPDRVMASFTAGATSYLVKPIDLGLLDEELRSALEGSEKATASRP